MKRLISLRYLPDITYSHYWFTPGIRWVHNSYNLFAEYRLERLGTYGKFFSNILYNYVICIIYLYLCGMNCLLLVDHKL
jgi:hypothetical protein